jgi:hypothetical protein
MSVVAARRTARVLAWKGPDPARVDAAPVTLGPDGALDCDLELCPFTNTMPAPGWRAA